MNKNPNLQVLTSPIGHSINTQATSKQTSARNIFHGKTDFTQKFISINDSITTDDDIDVLTSVLFNKCNLISGDKYNDIMSSFYNFTDNKSARSVYSIMLHFARRQEASQLRLAKFPRPDIYLLPILAGENQLRTYPCSTYPHRPVDAVILSEQFGSVEIMEEKYRNVRDAKLVPDEIKNDVVFLKKLDDETRYKYLERPGQEILKKKKKNKNKKRRKHKSKQA